jgi:hypothetical protein
MSGTWSNLASCELDPVSGLIVILSEQSTTGLWTYDPVARTAVRRLAVSNLPGYANNLIYFPPNDKFYFIDNGNSIYEVTLNRSNWAASTVTQMTGITGDVPSLPETGFAYDPANGVIGGGVVNGVFHTFNPLTKAWTAGAIQTSSATAVGSQQFHALDYDPVNNVYIFMANWHTWAYRYAGGASRVENKIRPLFSPNRFFASSNPFGSAVALSVQGGTRGMTLRIYDLKGNLAADLTQGIIRGVVTWKPACRPGVYVARLQFNNASQSLKLVFLK